MRNAMRIKERRKAAGLRQEDVARAIGITRAGYQMIESGRNGKSFSYLPKIAKAIGCRIDDLFPEMDEQETLPNPQTADDDLSDLNL